VAVQVKARKVENRFAEIDYYRRGVTVASFLVFSVTFFLITLSFRLISSLFAVLEYSFQSFNNLKPREITVKERSCMETGRERRKYPRFDVYWPIEYNHTGSHVSHDGRVTNLSEGGMQIQSPGKMKTGQQLKSKVSFILGSKINTIEFQAEVMWNEGYLNEVKGEYRYGARFLDISLNDKTKLNNLLSNLSQQSPCPS
jgi:hypothetical protein